MGPKKLIPDFRRAAKHFTSASCTVKEGDGASQNCSIKGAVRVRAEFFAVAEKDAPGAQIPVPATTSDAGRVCFPPAAHSIHRI